MEYSPISYLKTIQLVEPDIDVRCIELNKHLHLYKILYNISFIYPEHKVSYEDRGSPKVYSYLIDVVSKDYYYDVYNHKRHEIPITTCTNNDCTFGFRKGAPFITATLFFYGRLAAFGSSMALRIHNPKTNEYEKLTFMDPVLFKNPEIIKTLMEFNKCL